MNLKKNKVIKKINFGCGTDLKEGYLNIDSVSCEGCNPENYQFLTFDMMSPQILPKESFELIEAQMVFEHIHPDKIPTVIYVMSCCLQEGGEVHVTVPDFGYFAKQYLSKTSGSFSVEQLVYLRECTFQLLDPVFTENKVSVARGHQSLWTQELAAYWFESEGFTIKELKSENGILFFIAKKETKFSTPVIGGNNV